MPGLQLSLGIGYAQDTLHDGVAFAKPSASQASAPLGFGGIATDGVLPLPLL